MIKHNEPNLLDVFGIRKLNHCPPHFEKVVFDLRTDIKGITDWIYENLSGRFYIGDAYIPNPDDVKQMSIQKVVAFELHEEASFFGLFLPNINQYHFSI